MSSTFFFIVSEALSNVQFSSFLPYLNSHFCIHCCLNQKFRETSPDTSFSLLSNINRLPIPHMSSPIITHMRFSFPPTTFPLFFSLVLLQVLPFQVFSPPPQSSCIPVSTILENILTLRQNPVIPKIKMICLR